MSFLIKTVAKWYGKSLSRRLAEYGMERMMVETNSLLLLLFCFSIIGLKYDDILIETADVKLALSRIDAKTQLARSLKKDLGSDV